jgi:hypothetical protein
MTLRKKKATDIELRPDGWERFTSAVDAAVKGGPKHRAVPKPKRQKRKRTSGDLECEIARNSGSDAILVVSWLTGADDAGLE